MHDTKLRIAGAQLASVATDVDKNIAAMNVASEEAAGLGVDILVFPELFVSGYNVGPSFVELSEPKEGSIFQAIASMAREHQIAICYGYPEKQGTVIYNSSQLVDSNGNSLINHRKTHLYGAYEKDWFVAGEIPTNSVNYRGFTISTLICYEIEFPELARANALAGCNLVLVPTAIVDQSSPDNVTQLLVKARAAENNIFVVYVNHAIGEENIEFNGQSLIAGPMGKVQAESVSNARELVVADICTNDITAAAEVVPYLTDVRSHLF